MLHHKSLYIVECITLYYYTPVISMALHTYFLAACVAISACMAQPYHTKYDYHMEEDVYSVEEDALILEERNVTSEETSNRIVNNPSCGVGGTDDCIIGGSPVPDG